MHAVLDSPEAALPGTASTTELFSGLWRDSDPDNAVHDLRRRVMSVLGWLIFGKFMSEATGADPEDVRRAIAEQVSQLISSQALRQGCHRGAESAKLEHVLLFRFCIDWAD